MTIGIKDLVDQINSEIDSPANDSTRVAQLAGSTTFNTYSVVTVDALPLASENTGRFVLVLSSDSYYFSDGVKWTNKVESTVGGIVTLWLWGKNAAGELGDGTTLDKSSPVSITTNLGWHHIGIGGTSSVAMKYDNTLWSWGCNRYGNLGDGTTANKSSPVSVVGGFTDWREIKTGCGHSIAIRSNGTAWAWGCNRHGNLGDGTTANKSSPVSVVGGFTDWKKIAAGFKHSIAIRSNGTLWSWGYNTCGILGDNTSVQKSSPVSVVGGFADWCNISAGAFHTIGLRSDGTLWSWGYNGKGTLGDGTTVNKSSPTAVVGGFTDWCGISAGEEFSVGIRMGGTAWSWGSGIYGKLGDGTAANKSSPVSVVGGFTDWCNVGTGAHHVAGVRTNGTAWSWGSGIYGKLGDGTAANKSSPVSVVGGFTDWCEANASSKMTAMIRYIPKGL